MGSQALQVRVVGGVQSREIASLDERGIYTKPGLLVYLYRQREQKDVTYQNQDPSCDAGSRQPSGDGQRWPLMATSLELSLTLAQTTGVHRRVLQEGSTLSGFGLDIVTGMGRDDAGKASQASKESRGADHSGERLYND